MTSSATIPGPEAILAPGTHLDGAWRISRLAVAPGRVTVVTSHGTDESVDFVVSPPEGDGDSGPFDIDGVRICYATTPVPFQAFCAAGQALRRVLRNAAGSAGLLRLVRGWVASAGNVAGGEARGVPNAFFAGAAGPGPTNCGGGALEGKWQDRARTALVDRPEVALRVGRVMTREELPELLCVHPWTRLELGTRRAIGPCCSDYQVEPRRLGAGEFFVDEWNGETMRRFRRALATGRPSAYCSTACPTCVGGSGAAREIELRGGSPAFVDAQIELVEEILGGHEVVRSGPFIVCFPATTYCNYDCLMCDLGQIGTLDDELPASFYASLRRFARGLQRIEVLGGEPLASPVFRDYLASEDFQAYPGLELSITTNGSYLTPQELRRFAKAPPIHLVISLNAATPETYAAVNRGLPFARIRANLDHLLTLRRSGSFRGAIAYSMVILKRNLHEVPAFAELARADGVAFRFRLPTGNRNHESILTDLAAMARARESLEGVLAGEEARGELENSRYTVSETRVLCQRLEKRLARTLPDRVG